jgi:hypothetical protein
MEKLAKMPNAALSPENRECAESRSLIDEMNIARLFQ